ncbi:prenyltransferase [Acidilobus sp.]|jgi:1,4-dihydroxy-2-naphthoate octaprenyltransferase|uniref:prenyltransferase n=1 Tax=Acidilobus sp. TaxID=1872109 RepID=UPI003D06B226
MVNIFNDYFDFKLSFDSAPSPVRLHPILNGITKPCNLRRDAVAVGLAGLSLGVAVTVLGRPLATMFGLIGISFGYGYSDPRIGFKYKALGDLVYPLSMVILAEAGFYLASGRLLPEGLLAGLPVVIATEGVLFANYWRDIDRDRSLGARTWRRSWAPGCRLPITQPRSSPP